MYIVSLKLYVKSNLPKTCLQAFIKLVSKVMNAAKYFCNTFSYVVRKLLSK